LNLILPPEPTLVVPLILSFYNNDEGINVGHFNNISCQLPTNTSFLALLLAGVPYSNSCLTYSIPLHTVVRLIINNHDTGEHPIHLHGHTFWILAEAPPQTGDYDNDPLDLETPLVRDTVTVNAMSYLVIQFVANNPGVWFMHCHIDWHMMVGLGLIWEVGQEEVVERLGSTEELQYCSVSNSTGGESDGEGEIIGGGGNNNGGGGINNGGGGSNGGGGNNNGGGGNNNGGGGNNNGGGGSHGGKHRKGKGGSNGGNNQGPCGPKIA